MKIGIQTWGSNGDIRPMIALADGLQKAGHRVTLIASSIDNRSYRAECEQRRISYRQVPEQIGFHMQGFAARTFRMHPLQWLRALLDEAFFPWEEEIFEAAQVLAAENDLVIGHHFLYPLKLAAQLQGKPFYSVTLCPVAIPVPPEAPFRFPDLGRYINPLSWKLLDAVVNGILRKPLIRLWQASGQTPPASVLNDLLTSQALNLIAVDPVFCPGNEAWASYHQVCGVLNLAEDDAGSWPPGLAEFIENGPPPVYMTFGSLQQAVPEWSMELFLEAAERADVRAIIQTVQPDTRRGARKAGLS